MKPIPKWLMIPPAIALLLNSVLSAMARDEAKRHADEEAREENS